MTESISNSESCTPRVKVVDLFCGAGGLAYGLKCAGFEISVGVDLDPACKHPFETNCGGTFIEKSIEDLSKADLEEWFEGADIRLLAGCAPCQPFSTYSQSRKSPDKRWELLLSFLRLAVELRPEVVTMENVSGLASKEVWGQFVEGLETAGYSVSWDEVSCADFDIPQSRKRLVLIASTIGRIEVPIPDVKSTNPTVRDAIYNLRRLAAGEADPDDILHMASRLSATNLKRIKASKPGGTWRDWPDKLRASCHRKKAGETYPSVYGRMSWDETAPTITTQCFGYGNGRFGHPEQDRAITLREAAILQSFPATYSFIDDEAKPTFSKLGMLIGNAVPPKLGEAIAWSISKHLDSTIVQE